MLINKIKNLIKRYNNQYIKKIKQEIKEHEKEKQKLIRESKRKLSRLEISEFILDYTYQFNSNYMLYNNLTIFIKKMSFKERMKYIIDSCNKENPTIMENFLLALAYSNLGTRYTNYAIYYLELYLENKNYYSDNFYNKEFKGCNTTIENRKYQLNLLYVKLSQKYLDNLNYDKALNYAFKAKEFMNVDNYYQSFWEPYSLIAEILYKKGDLNNCIANINEGIIVTKNKHNKKKYIELLNKYIKYQKNM